MDVVYIKFWTGVRKLSMALYIFLFKAIVDKAMDSWLWLFQLIGFW